MKKTFFKYVIPSILSMWVYAIYTIVDGIFVAKGVGEYAFAAIDLSMPIINTIFAISIMFAIGTSTIVAIYIGEDNVKRAKEVFTTNMFILFIT